jgi:hypothetical protein
MRGRKKQGTSLVELNHIEPHQRRLSGFVFFWGFCVVSLQGMLLLQLEERDNAASGLASKE